MLKKQIIFAIAIFALVSTRANVFAQSGLAIKPKLLHEGLDSLLKTKNFSLIGSEIIDINGDSSFYTSPAYEGPIKNRIVLTQDSNFYKLLYFSNNYEEVGDYGIIVSGTLDHLDGTPSQPFSFTRTRRYTCKYQDYEESPHRNDTLPNSKQVNTQSFWDSTAKPVLVTIGAAAVVALFFLVRG